MCVNLMILVCFSVVLFLLERKKSVKSFEQFWLIYGQVHIVYLGARKQDDPALETASHHDMLASVIGR